MNLDGKGNAVQAPFWHFYDNARDQTDKTPQEKHDNNDIQFEGGREKTMY